MGQTILGALATLWGGAILLRFLLASDPVAGSAYASGQMFAVVFGAVIPVVGARALVQGVLERA